MNDLELTNKYSHDQENEENLHNQDKHITWNNFKIRKANSKNHGTNKNNENENKSVNNNEEEDNANTDYEEINGKEKKN